MRWVSAFLAGFLSTLIFHQGLLALLHLAGASPRPAYVMTPPPPLGVPQVLSLAFWGGVWGIALWLAIRSMDASWLYWVSAVGFGALFPSIVALFVVLPLNGQAVARGWEPSLIVGALLLNGAWGIG